MALAEILEKISSEQLLKILNCQKTNTFGDILDEITTAALLAELQQLKRKSVQNKITESAYAAANALGYPVFILWYLLGLITLSAFPLGIITSIVVAAAAVIGSIFFAEAYKKSKKAGIKNEEKLAWLELKIEIANYLINRADPAIKLEKFEIDQRAMQAYCHKKYLPRLKEATSVVAIVCFTLFSTFFLVTHDLLAAFGFSVIASSMVGPLGLTIAVASFFIISLYFGYKTYQTYKYNDEQKFQQKEFTKVLDKKIEACNCKTSSSNKTVQNSTNPATEPTDAKLPLFSILKKGAGHSSHLPRPTNQ